MAANAGRSDTFQWEDIQATENARQHIGHAYHNTTHNYAGAMSHANIPVKPPEAPIHDDLMRACRQGQGPRRLNFLLARGADIEYRDEKQMTPLHQAASSGSLSTLSCLVDDGADIHAFASRVGTPLHSAALSGSKEVVEYLIKAGCKVDATDIWIGTPLHGAALCGSTDTVRCLLESGANLDKFSRWVGTPLSIAAAKSHVGVVEVLLEYGADANAACGLFGSATHMACASGDTGVLQRLQRAGACFNEPKTTCRVVYCGILQSVNLSFPGTLGDYDFATVVEAISGCPVIMAIMHGKLEAAKFCMDMDRDTQKCRSHLYSDKRLDREEWRTLSAGTRHSICLAIAALDDDMLHLILGRGVVPDKWMKRTLFSYLGSDIRAAASDGFNASACMSLLLPHISPIYSLDDDDNHGGTTLLIEICQRASRETMYEVLKALLDHGAPVDAIDKEGRTALMIAARDYGELREHCVQLLCDHGAAVDLKDVYGRTALMHATASGDGKEGFENIKKILQSYSRHEPEVPRISWARRLFQNLS